MNTQGTGMYTGLVHDVGHAVLFLVVSFILLWFGGYYMLGAGVDTTLLGYTRIDTHDSSVPLGMGVELVALPIAAIAAAWLRWGEEAIAVARTGGIGPLLPLLGAGTLFGVFWYLDWFWSNPQDLLGIDPRFGVQRWLSVALMAGVVSRDAPVPTPDGVDGGCVRRARSPCHRRLHPLSLVHAGSGRRPRRLVDADLHDWRPCGGHRCHPHDAPLGARAAASPELRALGGCAHALPGRRRDVRNKRGAPRAVTGCRGPSW